MENMIFCQSCGMPMSAPETFGTEADGSKSEDYCCYCRKGGAFTWDCTMEEMAEFCAKAEGQPQMGTPEETKAKLLEWFPTLKRWKRDA